MTHNPYRKVVKYSKKEEDYHTHQTLLNMRAGDDTGNHLGTALIGRQNSKRRKAAKTVSSFFSSLPLTLSRSSSETSDPVSISSLQQENDILRTSVAQLERQNEILERRQKGQSIVIEQFEGEGQPMYDINGGSVGSSTWWDGDPEQQSLKLGLTRRDGRSTSIGSSVSTLGNPPATLDNLPATISSAPAPAAEDTCDIYDDGTCPTEPDISFKAALKDRACWLVGLLTLQSLSGFILARNENLLQTHPVIVYFLTMLVGAGGNAGNQAAVRGEIL